MNRKHKIKSVYDLARISAKVQDSPKFKVINANGTTSYVDVTGPMFRERLARQAKEQADLPIRQSEDSVVNELEQNNNRNVAGWSQDLEVIKKAGHKAPFAFVSGLAVDFPRLPSDPEAIKLAEIEAQNAFAQFVAKLPAKGYRLSEDGGIVRFAALCMAHQLNGIRLTPAVIAALWEWSIGWEIYAPEELSVENIVKPPVEPEPLSFDETLATVSGETLDGERTIKAALANDFYTSEVGPFWREWQSSLCDNFNGYVMPEHVKKAAYAMFTELNLSWTSPASYDRVRRELVHRMLAPQSLLVVSEILDQMLDKGSITRTEYLRRCEAANLRGTYRKARATEGI